MKITVDGIEYDNEKDAKKAMAKAKREEAKRDAEREAQRQIAKTRAAEHYLTIAYNVNYMLDGYTPHTEYVPYHATPERKEYDWEATTFKYTYETEEATRTFSHKYQIPVAFLYSSNGYVLAVQLEDITDPSVKQWDAVGICNDQFYFERIPAFIAAHFPMLPIWDKYKVREPLAA